MITEPKLDELVIYREAKDGYVTAKFMVGDESCGILRFPAKTWGLFKTALQSGAIPIVGKPPILRVTIRGMETPATPAKAQEPPAGAVDDDLLAIAE